VVSAARFLASEPPRRPLNDLWAVCEDFKWRFADRDLTDQVIDWCRRATSWKHAVKRACGARGENGKMHNHQSRVKEKDRKRLADALIGSEKEIRKGVGKADAGGSYWYTGFDYLYDWINEHSGSGIGPVTTYDVAVRVGAWLRIEPKSLYLHAGVMAGAKALLGPDATQGMARLPMSILPDPLSEMPADTVEDILCTYREIFEGWRRIPPQVVGKPSKKKKHKGKGQGKKPKVKEKGKKGHGKR
jgi:hypothetical protein